VQLALRGANENACLTVQAEYSPAIGAIDIQDIAKEESGVEVISS